MTSSLVGSEMCIRDRAQHDLGHSLQLLRSQKRSSGQNDDVDAISSSSSVSYTHLTLPTICSV
eukprot:11319984-Prorocentrum_lima.AAC.1